MTDLLEIRDLAVQFESDAGNIKAVDHINLTIRRGEVVGLVGESGSGKSVTSVAILRLIRRPGRVTSGTITFDGVDLASLTEEAMRQVRGAKIALVSQSPRTALNPVIPIGLQISRLFQLHAGLSAKQAEKRMLEMLALVRIPDPEKRARQYAHQLSGGMCQRVMIAMAISCQPKLLIADEPTTALDVTIQKQILELISELVAERGMALMLISHDLGVIAQNVTRTLVMYGGAVVESGPTVSVFRNRMHPYTRGLFAARPGLSTPRGQRLVTIAGTVPELADLPSGCTFAGRCQLTVPECRVAPPAPVEIEPGHVARCIRLDAVPAQAIDGVAA